jgi:hypothetical protein
MRFSKFYYVNLCIYTYKIDLFSRLQKFESEDFFDFKPLSKISLTRFNQKTYFFLGVKKTPF